MAKNTIIRSLPEDEQAALALCGISEDAQLARIAPQALLKDMEAAAAFFPEDIDTLPELERLEEICTQAATHTRLTRPNAEAVWQGMGGKTSRSGVPSAPEEPEVMRYSTATGRMLVDDQLEARKAISLDERRKKEDPRDFSHAICSQHPVAIYLGAWATLFLICGVLGLLLGVAGLLIGIDFSESSKPLLAGFVACVLFYAFMLGSATCSTCRISVFSFRRYPRHRKAHRLPLLGYTISTALYTIFFFRYRCPSCGTPQKLFGRRHRRSRKR